MCIHLVGDNEMMARKYYRCEEIQRPLKNNKKNDKHFRQPVY